MQRAAAAVLLAWAAGAHAHPHGRLACEVQLGLEQGRLAWVSQRLTLDAASSAALADRIQPGAAEPLPPPAAVFRDVVLGLFRQSGWMLELRAAGAAAPVELSRTGSAWSRLDDGRIALTLRLAPAATALSAQAAPSAEAAPPAEAWTLACRDPSWYWLAEFDGDAAVSASGASCTATLDGPRDAAAETAALTAAARAAGALGAERVAAAATAAPRLGAGRAELRCADQTVRPPSTGNSTPVMNSASSLAR